MMQIPDVKLSDMTISELQTCMTDLLTLMEREIAYYSGSREIYRSVGRKLNQEYMARVGHDYDDRFAA